MLRRSDWGFYFNFKGVTTATLTHLQRGLLQTEEYSFQYLERHARETFLQEAFLHFGALVLQLAYASFTFLQSTFLPAFTALIQAAYAALVLAVQ